MTHHAHRLKQLAALLLLAVLAPAGAAGQQLRLLFAGDLMGHGPQHKAALQPDGTYDFSPCFRFVKDYIAQADLAIVNLEVTLAGEPFTGYPQFSSPDALLEAARDAGFDIVQTANNHCLDRGRRGLERTLRVIDGMGMPRLGTYLDSADRASRYPLIVSRNGIRLALLCYTYGTNGIAVQSPNVVNMIDTAAMAADLQRAKDLGADFIVTLVHWGIEYQTRANSEQEQLAQWLLAHGSGAVVGGHAHVVQNFTADALPGNGRFPEVVVYSMGNLVSNQRDVGCDGGIMVELTLTKDLSSTSVTRAQYLPYWVHRGTVDSLYQYYIVPSTDAVRYPDLYQIGPTDLHALQRFDRDTRQRLQDCPTCDFISERLFYRAGQPQHLRYVWRQFDNP